MSTSNSPSPPPRIATIFCRHDSYDTLDTFTYLMMKVRRRVSKTEWRIWTKSGPPRSKDWDRIQSADAMMSANTRPLLTQLTFYRASECLFLINTTFNICKIQQYNQNLSGAIRYNCVCTNNYTIKRRKYNNKIK